MADSDKPLPLWVQYGAVMLSKFRWVITGDAIIIGLVLIYERIYQKYIPWSVYAGLVAACVVWVLLSQGFHEWKNGLPSLAVSKPMKQPWTDERGICIAYWINIRNKSTNKTIRDVKVTLDNIEPRVKNLDWLPSGLCLHLKQDETYGVKSFSINPGDSAGVDVVSAPVRGPMSISHIVSTANKELSPTDGHFRLTICVTGENIPRVENQLDVWLDDVGLLECNPVE